MIESSKANIDSKVLRYGMVGGGEGSFVGDVHRIAAVFDGKCKISAGCFSRDYDNTLKTGSMYGISTDRLYKNFNEMADAEVKREDCIDFVSIVTPNFQHYEIAKKFLSKGINVLCEKPLVFTVLEAEELENLAKEKGVLFCITYAYSGYPMVKQARQLIKDNKLGEILIVMGEYPQDWLISTVEKEGSRQAAWRTDPKQAGVSNCIGDIGTHIENTVSYITGLKINSLCAMLDIIGEDRTLDTNASVMLKYNNGASGIYWASQVAIGNDNALKIRIYGTKGSIEWSQENPNYLNVAYIGQPKIIMSRGQGYLDTIAASRTPSGHPEGYYEAFANVYTSFASALLKKMSGEVLKGEDLDFPNAEAGVDGVKFINACVNSSKAGAIWVEL